MTVKDMLQRYARYNQWAHTKLLDLILELSVEEQHATIPSSFNSLYKTVLHVWGASALWLGRLNLEPIEISGDPFNASTEDLARAMELVDQQWVDWFKSKTDQELTENLNYNNLAGKPFSQSYDLLLQHIFNHSTYHNGQLVTMLRALGLDKIPATDFVAWTFLEKQ
jgi:uncharacterized damage-inducible protein DinB